MRTTRKIITLITALAMVFASVVPAFAADLTDLEGHWSKTFIERLVDKGIMSGYTDKTARPDKTMSAAEAFTMLANLYELSDETKDEIYKDYGAAVEKVTAQETTNISWANKPLSICLAAGVFTESEMKNITFSSEIPKQNLAVYMVRAIQRAEDAEKLADKKLDYKDAADITSKCRGSIALLTDMGIITGDNSGNVTPKSPVTRAVFAAMLCNILDYLDKEHIKLEIEDYLGLDTAEGILMSLSNSAIILRGYDGIYRSFPRDAEMKSTVNGSAKSLSSSYAGDYIKIQSQEGKTVSAAVTDASNVTYKQGRIATISSNTVSIKLTDLESGASDAYVLNTAKIIQDGKEINFADLTKGAFATLRIEKGTVKEITADTKEHTVEGAVGAVSYDTIVTMNVKEDEKSTAVLYMDLADMPLIKKGSLTITVDRLSEGEKISAGIKGGEVIKITTEGKDANAAGTLTIITRTVNSTTWTIKQADGTSVTYNIDPAAAAFSEEKAIKLDTINPGDEVSVIVTAGIISEVTLTKTLTPASDKLSAEVLAVDTSTKVLTVLKDNKLTYINCKSASVLNSETGKTISFGALAAGDRIVAYGAYTDSTNFAATSIVIELKH